MLDKMLHAVVFDNYSRVSYVAKFTPANSRIDGLQKHIPTTQKWNLRYTWKIFYLYGRVKFSVVFKLISEYFMNMYTMCNQNQALKILYVLNQKLCKVFVCMWLFSMFY
jgi:hypothetical protein